MAVNMLNIVPTYQTSSSNVIHSYILTILKGLEMAKNDITLFLGQRWAAALKKHFGPKNTSKEIARFFGIEERTARSWLAGSTPYIKHLWLAGQKIGSGFLAEILTPNNKWKTYANIDEALDLMEKQICQLRKEIQNLTRDSGK